MAADLLKPGAARALGEAAGARHGRIDAVVNVAAIAEATDPNDPDEIERSVARHAQINLAAPMALISACLPFMEGGAVVHIGSMNARFSPPGHAAYAASKAALEGATRAMAREFGSRAITVNAVAPGFIETEMSMSGGDMVKL